MSEITYRGVRLEILHTREVVNIPIFSADRTTYLYTQRTVDFDCVYNPKATAFKPGVFPLPLTQVGSFPFATDNALQHYLSQPRGTLIVEMGNGEIIRSPRLGSVTDVKNGPIVEVCEVHKVQGLRTWMVRFRITTWVNQCYEKSTSPNPVGNPMLAHRWRQWVDVDRDHYTTRVTEGEAIFDVDALLRSGTYPDAYRYELNHPIPPNFQRGPIHVEALSDGSGVRYMLTDTEKPFNFGTDCEATRIEAYQTAGYDEPDAWRYATSTIGGAIPNMLMAMATLNPGFVAGAGVREIGGAVVRALPKFFSRVFVRAWGNRESSRLTLTTLATQICASRIGIIGWRGSRMNVTHDLTGKFVEAEVEVNWGMDTAIAQNVFTTVGNGIGNAVMPGLNALIPNQPTTWMELLNTFIANERINVNAAQLTLNQDAGTGNPAPTNNRGTTLVAIIAQALATTDCAIPARPRAYAPVVPQTLPYSA